MTIPDDRRGLGTPAGPEIRWTAPPTPAPPAWVRPVAAAPAPATPKPSRPRPRIAPRISMVIAAAVLAGGASGAAMVMTMDRDGALAGPAIVQERTVPRGSAGTAAGSTVAAADQILPSVVQVRAGRGSGSGVVMDAEGHVLTNHHVVDGARNVSLVLAGGRTVSATVVGSDEDNDIAVLRAVAGDLPAARLGVSADLRIGQPVIAVGSPLGLNGTVTSGVVSALDRRSTAESMIQTDASINPGNSGGPLVDLDGRVVGINTSIATLGGRGSGNIGIGFAVPIDRAVEVARQILARG